MLFNYGTVEVLHMRWLKKDIWKAGIAFAGILLFLVLMMWMPVSAADAYEETSGLATPGTVTTQSTPTEDATVTALNKEKLAQEVQQLKNQNEPDPFGLLRTNASILLSTLVVVIGGLIGQFYSQTFDLAIAHLRLRGRHSASTEHLSSPSSSPPIVPHKPLTQGRQSELNTPLSLDPLSQTLIAVFKESFPLARSWMTKQSPQESPFDPLTLDAADIQLDKAYLPSTDLAHCRLPRAYLRQANLWGAHLQGANLGGAHLEGTLLQGALLQGTLLRGTLLQGALLRDANLQGALLRDANLQGANLSEAVLDGVHELEEVLSLKDTDLRGVKGLTKEQLEACKAKGAIIDEDSTTSPPQPTVSSSVPLQSNDAQALPSPPAQASTPPSETGGSSAPSSQQGPVVKKGLKGLDK